jgi:hypothetical protein
MELWLRCVGSIALLESHCQLHNSIDRPPSAFAFLAISFTANSYRMIILQGSQRAA